jgi:hypothetical protein
VSKFTTSFINFFVHTLCGNAMRHGLRNPPPRCRIRQIHGGGDPSTRGRFKHGAPASPIAASGPNILHVQLHFE